MSGEELFNNIFVQMHGLFIPLIVLGKLVVNIWGGLADKDKKTPWTKDTLGVFWSTTKGISAIVVAHLVDR